jgi:methylase of polypeptide subunit release factors
VSVAVSELAWSEGVHAPSAFSELLVDSLPDPAGLVCVDAGCGAGLVTIALLRRGARQVFAFDKDRDAIRDARTNVGRLVPDASRARIRMGGFAELSGEPCDLLLCNPPQRPKALWADLERAAQRAFYVAGDDGLGAVRLVLARTHAPRAVFSLSSLVCADASALAAEFGREAHVLGEHVVRHDPIWARISPELAAPARVWELRSGCASEQGAGHVPPPLERSEARQGSVGPGRPTPT